MDEPPSPQFTSISYEWSSQFKLWDIDMFNYTCQSQSCVKLSGFSTFINHVSNFMWAPYIFGHRWEKSFCRRKSRCRNAALVYSLRCGVNHPYNTSICRLWLVCSALCRWPVTSGGRTPVDRTYSTCDFPLSPRVLTGQAGNQLEKWQEASSQSYCCPHNPEAFPSLHVWPD